MWDWRENCIPWNLQERGEFDEVGFRDVFMARFRVFHNQSQVFPSDPKSFWGLEDDFSLFFRCDQFMTRKMWLPVQWCVWIVGPRIQWRVLHCQSQPMVTWICDWNGCPFEEELCLIMALVGVANIVASSLQGACFKIFSELQQLGIRPNLGGRWGFSVVSSSVGGRWCTWKLLMKDWGSEVQWIISYYIRVFEMPMTWHESKWNQWHGRINAQLNEWHKGTKFMNEWANETMNEWNAMN